MINVIKKIKKKFFFTLLKAGIDRLSFGFIKINLMYFLKYENIPEFKETRYYYQLRWADENDLKSLTECLPKNEIYINRFKRGDHCVVIEDHQKKIIGYEWFTINPTHLELITGYNVVVPNNSIFAYDAYIIPEYRIRGIWVAFKKKSVDLMRKYNRINIITFVFSGNKLSLNTHFRFGFVIYQRVISLKLFNFNFYRVKQIKS